jgi:hypothetical protein
MRDGLKRKTEPCPTHHEKAQRAERRRRRRRRGAGGGGERKGKGRGGREGIHTQQEQNKTKRANTTP